MDQKQESKIPDTPELLFKKQRIAEFDDLIKRCVYGDEKFDSSKQAWECLKYMLSDDYPHHQEIRNICIGIGFRILAVICSLYLLLCGFYLIWKHDHATGWGFLFGMVALRENLKWFKSFVQR